MNHPIVQGDGKIVVCGSFSKGISRLNADGTIDQSFSTSGVNGWGNTLAIQEDDKVLMGGVFHVYNSIDRNTIARIETKSVVSF